LIATVGLQKQVRRCYPKPLPGPPLKESVAGSKELAPQRREERKEEENKEEKTILLRKTAFSLLPLSFFASFASLRCKAFL
jgi:hypothetical protein